jgi:uncharacterized delta-60 repeat protein
MQRTLTLLASAALSSMLLFAQPGTLDTSFNPGTGANGSVDDLVLQPDGKVIIVGNFTTVAGNARNRVARLNADGSLDTGFNPGAGADDLVTAVALQSDGKVLIGGFFTTVGGTARNFIARLNADGTLDNGFNPGTGANSAVLEVAAQPDGKVLIAGFFTSVNGTARGRVARLNADGTLDTGFTTGAGAGGNVLAMALQQDGKIVIGGEFVTYAGTSRNRIARLNENGSLDTGFTVGTGVGGPILGFTDVLAVAVQPDGKVIIAGRFDSFNGTPRSNIARLNTNGSLDTGFTAGTGETYCMALQTNGKVITGNFMSLLRLTETGFDPDFVTGTSVDSWVYALAVQPDGKILVAGEFTSYNGTPRSKIMRINGDNINVGLEEATATSDALRLYPNPSAGGTVWMDVPQGMNGTMQVELIGTDGRIVQRAAMDPAVTSTAAQQIAFDVDPVLPAGTYVVRVTSAARMYMGRLSIAR